MPDFAREQGLLAKGLRSVAGVDEAGRGPLAGPVVAAAVILDPAMIPRGLNDSKQISEARREALFAQIMANSHVGIAMLPPREIDRLNIRGASLEAMRLALLALPIPAAHALIDGRDVPPRLSIPATAIIKGDALVSSIAAASIIAKVMRDRLMRHLDLSQPGYGFNSNMGYPTAAHRAAIAKLGGTPHHRMSFEPFKNGTPLI